MRTEKPGLEQHGGKRANTMSSKSGFSPCVLLINVYVFKVKAFVHVGCKYCCILCLNEAFASPLTEFSTQDDLLSVLWPFIDCCFYFVSEISHFLLTFTRSLM